MKTSTFTKKVVYQLMFIALLIAGTASSTLAQPYNIGGVDYSACGSSETVVASFANTAGALTTGQYRDNVLLTVSGTGQSLGSSVNDAFYLVSSQSHNASYYQLVTTIDPLVQYNPNDNAYQKLVYDVDADTETAPPYTPAYRADHTYRFVIDMNLLTPSAGVGVYANLRVGVGDGIFGDNAGSYTVVVQQLCCPDQDADGTDDCYDNCIATSNSDQGDADSDGIGDACDVCPDDADHSDYDGDGYPDCASCGNNKILICHVPQGNPCNEQQLCVNENAAAGHIDGGHGNCYIGACLMLYCNDALSSDSPGGQQWSVVRESHNHSVVEQEADLEVLKFDVMPNPARERVMIRLGEIDGSAQLIIFNQQGQVVWTRDVTNQNNLTINPQDHQMAPGTYVVSLEQDGKVSSRLLVVTN